MASCKLATEGDISKNLVFAGWSDHLGALLFSTRMICTAMVCPCSFVLGHDVHHFLPEM